MIRLRAAGDGQPNAMQVPAVTTCGERVEESEHVAGVDLSVERDVRAAVTAGPGVEESEYVLRVERAVIVEVRRARATASTAPTESPSSATEAANSSPGRPPGFRTASPRQSPWPGAAAAPIRHEAAAIARLGASLMAQPSSRGCCFTSIRK